MNSTVTSILDGKPGVQETWRLEAKPWGTLVNVTLVVETSGSLKHLLYRLTGRQKTEQYLDEVLSRLMVTAFIIASTIVASAMRATPPALRISAGTPFKPSACREWTPSLYRRDCQEGLIKQGK